MPFMAKIWCHYNTFKRPVAKAAVRSKAGDLLLLVCC